VEDMRISLNRVYHRLSRYPDALKGTLVIEERFPKPNERAGLVALMKVQDKWHKRVVWMEKKSEQGNTK